MDARRDRRARRPRHPGRLVRQCRHRHARAAAELHPARARSHRSVRERHPRHGPDSGRRQNQSLADQCQQEICHARAGWLLRPSCRQFCHDPWRPSRSLRARLISGGRERRLRQLDVRRRRHAVGRRRHGSGRRRQGDLVVDGSHHQERRQQSDAPLHLSAHRGRRRQARLHQSRRARHYRQRLRRARSGGRLDVRSVAGRHRRAAAVGTN